MQRNSNITKVCVGWFLVPRSLPMYTHFGLAGNVYFISQIKLMYDTNHTKGQLQSTAAFYFALNVRKNREL